ncbi:hypothetical protein PFISCL1PPCAC_2667, partial [Pristionchus fissidentatus]
NFCGLPDDCIRNILSYINGMELISGEISFVNQRIRNLAASVLSTAPKQKSSELSIICSLSGYSIYLKGETEADFSYIFNAESIRNGHVQKRLKLIGKFGTLDVK